MSCRIRAVSVVFSSALLTSLAGCSVSGTAGIQAASATQPSGPLALIREEGLNRSKIPETAEYLCNVIGPRLTASPGVRHANEWTRDTLAGWGLTNSHLEPWGPFGRGWTFSRFSLVVTSPYTFVVTAYPKAWSPGFDRPLETKVVYLDTKSEAGLAAYKDKIKGAIVLIGSPRKPDAHFMPQAVRLDEDRLAAMAELPANNKSAVELLRSSAPTPANAKAKKPPTTSRTAGLSTPVDLAAQAFAAKALAFAAKNGAAAVLTPSPSGDGNAVFVAQALLPDETPRKSPAGPTTRPRTWWPDAGEYPAQVAVGIEDFNRLVSLSRLNVPVTASLDLQAKFTDDLPQQYNTIAEIPGTDLADQIVMIGGHLDSWHSATGATDNAAGAVTAMEAVRLIHAAGLHPRRTIRVALWTGEEEGLLGSTAYVKDHFGDLPEPAIQPATRPTTQPAPDAAQPLAVHDLATTKPASPRARLVKGPEYDKLVAYFNLDNGTGKIRGIYAQNNLAAIPLFKQWLAPLADLGATTVTPANTGSTDHISFDRIGLPGFQFIQDPIEYFPRTHHSDLDTFDRLQLDDLKQAGVVMASFLWNAANADQPMPRKPWVK